MTIEKMAMNKITKTRKLFNYAAGMALLISMPYLPAHVDRINRINATIKNEIEEHSRKLTVEECTDIFFSSYYLQHSELIEHQLINAYDSASLFNQKYDVAKQHLEYARNLNQYPQSKYGSRLEEQIKQAEKDIADLEIRAAKQRREDNERAEKIAQYVKELF